MIKLERDTFAGEEYGSYIYIHMQLTELDTFRFESFNCVSVTVLYTRQ
jgi:hypothetical protein